MNEIQKMMEFMIESNTLTEGIHMEYEDGNLTYEEASYLLERVNSIIEEKTKIEKNREKFKKDYDYNKEDGTIKVGNQRIPATIDSRLSTAMVFKKEKGQKTPSNLLLVGNEALEAKKKRRDAIIQHEIGHAKLHSPVMNIGDNPHNLADDKKLTEKSLTDTTAKSIAIKFNVPFYKALNFCKKCNDIESKIQRVIKKYPALSTIPKTELRELRDSAISIYKKYETEPTNHVETREFEADRYSANHTSSKDMRGALRELYKNQRKKIKNSQLDQSSKDYRLKEIRNANIKRIRYEIDDVKEKMKNVDKTSDQFKKLSTKKRDLELKLKEAPKNLGFIDKLRKKEPTPPTKSEKKKLEKYRKEAISDYSKLMEKDLQARTKLLRKSPLSVKQNSLYK